MVTGSLSFSHPHNFSCLSIPPQYCSIPVGLLEASDLGRLALSLFSHLDYRKDGRLKNYNKNSTVLFSRTGFFLSLASGQFHFHYKLKFEDNYGAPLYNYCGFSRMCHRLVKCWTGLDCRVSAKISRTPFIFLFEWICVCTRVYILLGGCVFVCLYTCVVEAKARRWHQLSSSLTLSLIWEDRNSHWAWGPRFI